MAPVAPWFGGILASGALAGLLKVGTDFYRARTEDRRSRVEEAKITVDMLRDALEELRGEADRLEERLRARRRWNVEAEQLKGEAEELMEAATMSANDEELLLRPGDREKVDAILTGAADVRERFQDLMLRHAELPPADGV